METRDLSPYLDDMEAADRLLLDPALAQRIHERSRKRLVTLRLPVWQVEAAKRIAERERRPYQRVLQSWVSEGLSLQLRDTPRNPPRGTGANSPPAEENA